jgi:phosphate transport system permease protein
MSAPGPGTLALPPVSARRRRSDTIARALLAAGTAIAVIPLALILYYVIVKGLGAWSIHFFTSDPTGSFTGDPGGIRSAIVGTIAMVGLATLISAPIGIGIALYLTEYGKDSRFATVIRFFVDVMTGVPSIMFGLFIFITLVATHFMGNFAGWKGSAALALLMLPIVTRSAEVVLNLVPDGLREAALALGAPRWKIVLRVVLPTALPGIITGLLLAIARAAGETAPLIFTAFYLKATSFNLSDQMSSLPVQIYNDVQSPQDALVERAWGAALALVAMILICIVFARLIQRRSGQR